MPALASRGPTKDQEACRSPRRTRFERFWWCGFWLAGGAQRAAVEPYGEKDDERDDQEDQGDGEIGGDQSARADAICIRYRGDGGADVGGQGRVPRRRIRAGCRRARGRQGDPRLHRADGRLAAGHRQGEGLLRQARHARRRGRQAGLLGRDARQPRARLGRQRHRRRAHPDADALPDLDRQGDAEQRADADVHPGAPQSRRPGHLGRQRIQGPQGHRRRLAAQGRLRRRRRPTARR